MPRPYVRESLALVRSAERQKNPLRFPNTSRQDFLGTPAFAGVPQAVLFQLPGRPKLCRHRTEQKGSQSIEIP
jgi:hypothetical protein